MKASEESSGSPVVRYGLIILAGLVVVGAVGLYLTRPPAARPDAVTVAGTLTQGRLTAIAQVYTLQVDLKKRAPANLEQLRAFASSIPWVYGGAIPLTDELLVSSRDGQPLVIRFGLPIAPNAGRDTPGPDGYPQFVGLREGPVVAHEQEGVNGRRFVVYSGTNRIEEVDESRFKELVP